GDDRSCRSTDEEKIVRSDLSFVNLEPLIPRSIITTLIKNCCLTKNRFRGTLGNDRETLPVHDAITTDTIFEAQFEGSFLTNDACVCTFLKPPTAIHSTQ